MATILVADDEAAVRRLVRAILGGRGHRVLLAANAAEALRLAAAEPVDLLVTDVRTPGGGGKELAARLAEAVPPVPVLFVSGAVGDEALANRIEAGEVPFLAKPFAPSALASRVDALLGGASSAGGAADVRRDRPC